MNYANLIQNITENIKTNGSQAITGASLQAVLLQMVSELGQAGYIFGGVVNPGDSPASSDSNRFYVAATAGTYTNFNDATVNGGELAIFTYSAGGSWRKNSVTSPSAPIRFGSFRVHQDGLIPGRSLELSARFNISKNTRIIATIDGVVDTIQVGVGYAGGMWVELTQTQVKTRYNASQTVHQTFNHGLTLGIHTTVIIEKTVTKEKQDEGLIKVIDDYGNIFSQIVTWWGSSVGTPFVRNGNSDENIDSSLSVMLADITKEIWMFGDSYFGFDTPQRWMYYPITWGYDSFLLNAIGAIDARESYRNFLSILSMGESIPAYAVWCLGMYGDRDTNGAVNPSWLGATQKFLSTCAERGIEPILATIPSVPNGIHTKLNEWVRTSGYRYIDFADAVESGSDYYWRGWGTSDALLSSDRIHPTAQGAVELACRALQDFPEITVL